MKPFKIIYYIFIAFIAILAFLLIVSVFPIPGNYTALVVLSGSMEPMIKVGSVVIVKPSEDYKVGDIITFSNGSKTPTTHRIVDIEQENSKALYTVKGDANEDPDSEKVLKENVIGRVLFSVPFLGYPLNFAKQPVGFLLLVWTPAIIIILGEINNIGAEIKKRKAVRLEGVLKEESLKKESKLSRYGKSVVQSNASIIPSKPSQVLQSKILEGKPLNIRNRYPASPAKRGESSDCSSAISELKFRNDKTYTQQKRTIQAKPKKVLMQDIIKIRR